MAVLHFKHKKLCIQKFYYLRIVAILGKSQKKTYGLTPTFAVIYKHMRCISFLRVLPGKLFQGVDDFFRQIIRFVHTHIVNPSSRTARASKPPRGYSDAFLERTTESSQVRKKNGRLFSKTPLVSRKSPRLFLRYGTLLKCEALLVRKN